VLEIFQGAVKPQTHAVLCDYRGAAGEMDEVLLLLLYSTAPLRTRTVSDLLRLTAAILAALHSVYRGDTDGAWSTWKLTRSYSIQSPATLASFRGRSIAGTIVNIKAQPCRHPRPWTSARSARATQKSRHNFKMPGKVT